MFLEQQVELVFLLLGQQLLELLEFLLLEQLEPLCYLRLLVLTSRSQRLFGRQLSLGLLSSQHLQRLHLLHLLEEFGFQLKLLLFDHLLLFSKQYLGRSSPCC